MVATTFQQQKFNVPEILKDYDIGGLPDLSNSSREQLEDAIRFSFNTFANDVCKPLATSLTERFREYRERLQENTERKAVIKCYGEALEVMNKDVFEWQDYLKSIFDSNYFEGKTIFTEDFLEFASVQRFQEITSRINIVRDRLYKSKLGDLQELVPFFASALTARFVSHHGADLGLALAKDIENLVEDFIHGIGQSMLDMLSLESVGALQWYKDDVSRFIFFRRRYNYGYDPNMVRKLSMQGDGDIFEEIACHDHHLIESFQCHPSNSPVDLPRRALDLIEETPNWIKPHLRMVVGTLINERIFSKSTKIGTWSMPNPCSIVGYDPGICLGPFVLNGWISTDPTGKKSFPSDEVRGPRRLAKSKQPVVLSFSEKVRRLLGDDQ